MIFHHKCNVELTKVHYCDITETGRNIQISIISKNEPRTVAKNSLIKKNIFGHKWVLKINESEDKIKKSHKLIYFLVFLSIIIAVSFGIFFSIDFKFTFEEITSILKTNEVPISTKNQSSSYCKCEINEICLKIVENEQPQCKTTLDNKDPTGCGGLCKINAEYCKKLDSELLVFQCRPLTNTLNCSSDLFNCGNRCIPTKMRCDGVINCSNESDEKNCECDLQTHFQCGNETSCLGLSKRCDGKVDCWDNFDEANCSRGCPAGKVPCSNGQCIYKENFCDGIYQCVDKSDELRGCETYN